ncbi:AcrR family transcriptional regulator [Natronobacillus azotifigens]|uniref:TetR/AcrR family transcriptional regulator n=1 Tax=Natronobacillus azotifigens TaxID=472978 RepID=A0A9J6RG77_9BACI|nr:TetR/AcrR family transcriptional regulator [Natronobacillus azotifigens]MCZ0704413.1 TetR/AcrR family transcriptional regulator [Natronobacillus azotifigens]
MNEKFLNLDPQKQARIIDAALQEFGEQGYEQASTNRIVKSAGIGKGMLFYYFKNKQSFYYYLLEYSLDLTLKDFLAKVDMEEEDFIERLYQMAQVKLALFDKHPDMMNFLGTFMLANEHNLPKSIQEKYEKIQVLAHQKMFDGINYQLFRQDVDVKKAFDLIRWSFEGYQNELKAKLQGKKFNEIDLTPYWEEFYDYLKLLKQVYYENEEGK